MDSADQYDTTTEEERLIMARDREEEILIMALGRLSETYKNGVMVLSLYTENPQLKLAYMDQIERRNKKILIADSVDLCDAGFDLFLPKEKRCSATVVNKFDFEIKCSAVMMGPEDDPMIHTGYYLYPRSSIVNTPFRLANSVGIIDAGYRGNIIGAFDCLQDGFYTTVMARYAQICAPNLQPFLVRLVEKETDLSVTERGSGGFGSTGL